MYTVPRGGQRGFHQRVEYNKRIMIMGNTEKSEFKIKPLPAFMQELLREGGVVNYYKKYGELKV